jgi:hypothetical protein
MMSSAAVVKAMGSRSLACTIGLAPRGARANDA